LVSLLEVADRTGQSEMRVLSALARGRKKTAEWWDGTPALSWSDAAWVAQAMRDDDERARRLTEEAVAEHERKLEAEVAAARREREKELANRRRLDRVQVSLPGGPETDWSD
jgi:hypothetical protein